MPSQRSLHARPAYLRLVLALLLAGTLSACGQSAGLTSGRLAPPDWLQGTWTYVGEDFFEVTSDNIRLESTAAGSTTAINFGQLPSTVSLTETANNATRYQFVMSGGGESSTYTFDWITDSRVDYTQVSGGVELGLTLEKR